MSSLLAVLGALGLALHIEKSGLPSLDEVAARFLDDDDDDGGDAGSPGARPLHGTGDAA